MLRPALGVLLGLALAMTGPACSCSGGTSSAPDTGSSTIDTGAAVDTGVTVDASGPAVDALVSSDAPPADGADAAVSCDPSRVRFSPSGTLVEGQLCDDVFACVPSSADAAALVAAAPDFDCSGAPSGGCTGVTCVFRPSTLDAAEIDEICAVTTLPSLSDLLCMIYL